MVRPASHGAKGRERDLELGAERVRGEAGDHPGERLETLHLHGLTTLEHAPGVAVVARADDDRDEVVDLVGDPDGLRVPRRALEAREVARLPLLPGKRLVLLADRLHELRHARAEEA